MALGEDTGHHRLRRRSEGPDPEEVRTDLGRRLLERARNARATARLRTRCRLETQRRGESAVKPSLELYANALGKQRKCFAAAGWLLCQSAQPGREREIRVARDLSAQSNARRREDPEAARAQV